MDIVKQYWYLWLILLVLVVALIFMMIKASSAMKKRNERIEREREFIEKFKFLVSKYSELDITLVESSDPAELTEGVATALQYKLEKSTNPDEEYNNTEQWKREVYALHYFSEDCNKSLSYFFKINGEPLPSILLNGLKSIGYDKIYPIVSQMYSMYDEHNESVSIDKVKISQLDEKFKNIFDTEVFFSCIKKYILNNVNCQKKVE